MQPKQTSWGRLVRGENGRSEQRLCSRSAPTAHPSLVPTLPFLALCVLALLVVGLARIDAAPAAPTAAPDPHPSATTPATPAPDPYPEAPPKLESEPALRSPTSTLTGSGSSPQPTRSAGSARDHVSKPKPAARPSTPRTESKGDAAVERTTAPRRVTPARLAVTSAAEARPLLFGGLALGALALASGSLLFLLTRAGRLETRS